MPRKTCLPLVCCLLLAWPALAEKKRIKLKNGRVIVGDVIETSEAGVKVQGKLAIVFYPKDQIEAVEDILSPDAEYEQRLAKIDAKDPDAHLALGQWAMEQKLYEEAVSRFKAALALKKDHAKASELLAEAQAKLSGGETPTDPNSGRTVPRSGKLFLQTDDIYGIRREELRDDDRVTVDFRKGVIDRFVKKIQGTADFAQKGAERAFRRWPRAKQAMYILQNTDEGDPIRAGILVKTDPAAMREFRTGIWRWIAGSCGSSRCHGARKGQGGLKLYNLSGRNVNVDYTNFLILSTFHKKGEQVIRRGQADRSLLLQYALPPTQAEVHHPKKIRPPFRAPTAGGYRTTLEWIKKLAGPRHPDYGIKKLPPNVMAPSTGLPGLNIPGPTTKPAKRTDVPF